MTSGATLQAGVELIRKKKSEKVYALTCPLITKNDGSKFGKTEDGNVWLDRKKLHHINFISIGLICLMKMQKII